MLEQLGLQRATANNSSSVMDNTCMTSNDLNVAQVLPLRTAGAEVYQEQPEPFILILNPT